MSGPEGSSASHDEADAVGRCGRLAATADVEFAEDRRDVMVDGFLGDEQPVGDLRVAQVLGEQREDLQLAGSEPGRVGPGLSARSARDPTRAAGSQPAHDHRRRRPGPERTEFVERAAQRVLLTGVGARYYMFVKETKVKRSGREYSYLQLVEGYRDENGKVRHRVVETWGARMR